LQGSNDVTDAKLKKPSASQVLNKIWKYNGFKGLYRGLVSTIVRECIGCTVFFGSYEWAREFLKPVGKRKEDCDALATMAAGSIAGICTSLIIYPVDVMKSRVQMAFKKSEYQIIKDQILRNGFRGLYSGLLPTMVKTLPVTGVLLLSVEFSKPFYRQLISKITSWVFNSSEENFFSVCDFVSGWTAGLYYYCSSKIIRQQLTMKYTILFTGIVSTLVGHPMDTVKVVQQVTNNTVIKTIGDIYSQDKASRKKLIYTKILKIIKLDEI